MYIFLQVPAADVLSCSIPAKFSLGMSEWSENVLEDEERILEVERGDRQHGRASATVQSPSFFQQDSRGAVLVDSKELTVSQVHVNE